MVTGEIGGSTAAAELAALTPRPRATAIGRPERLARIEAARARMDALGIDAMIVPAGASLRYLTGIAWGPSERLVALVLPRLGPPAIICPAFEAGSLAAVLGIEADMRLWQEDECPYRLSAQAAGVTGVGRIALDPGAAFFIYEGLAGAVPGATIVSAAPVTLAARQVKSPAELALMRHAKQITLEVHHRAARMLEPGITTGAVKRFIDAAHRALGADAGSTFCAVQFAEATAYPHGLPGEQTLREGDLVLIDTGCTIDGYHSDITRTYVFGTPRAEHRRVFAIEAEAQRAAFDAVRPGVPCEAIDGAARAVLEARGLGPDYRLPGLPHRTGHGIGLDIHEGPYLVRGDKTPLAPGMCFSDEPMIVLPDQFGIRLEDHFHVTETGAAWFTEPQAAIDRL